MDNQILIRALGICYTFISLPALAIIGVAYFRKHRTNGAMLLGGGAVAAAIGSLFNKLLPWQTFLVESQRGLPHWVDLSMSVALGVHLLGLNLMVIGLGVITFGKHRQGV